MKRTRRFTSSPFAVALADAVERDDVLCRHMALCRDDILDMSDEDLTLRLVKQRLIQSPNFRNTLDNIPYIYYYLFRYCCVNDYVLCNEMRTAFIANWNVFRDLYQRSIRAPVSTQRFETLCQLFSMNPDRPLDFTSDLVLNPARTITLLQHYNNNEEPYASFFRYQHTTLFTKCRQDRSFAQAMADLYSMVYPFGCPDASYYMISHHRLRLIALDLLKTLTVSSLDEQKIAFPNDPSRYNPLLYTDTLLSIFLAEVSVVVAINKKVLATGLLDMESNSLVQDDASYEKMLLALITTTHTLKGLCTKIDATWLYNFVEQRLKPLLRDKHCGSYNTANNLTKNNIEPRLLEPLRRLATTDLDDVLCYEEITGEMCDEGIDHQIHNPRLQKTQQEKQTSKEDLLISLKAFIDTGKRTDRAIPLAHVLYDELRRKEETPLSYWNDSPHLSKQEKLQHIYRILFYQCSGK